MWTLENYKHYLCGSYSVLTESCYSGRAPVWKGPVTWVSCEDEARLGNELRECSGGANAERGLQRTNGQRRWGARREGQGQENANVQLH